MHRKSSHWSEFTKFFRYCCVLYTFSVSRIWHQLVATFKSLEIFKIMELLILKCGCAMRVAPQRAFGYELKYPNFSLYRFINISCCCRLAWAALVSAVVVISTSMHCDILRYQNIRWRSKWMTCTASGKHTTPEKLFCFAM